MMIKKIDNQTLKREFTSLAGLIAVIILTAVLTGGASLEKSNVQTVLIQFMVVLVSAAGSMFVSATGALDLSIGGIIGICSVIGFWAGKGENVPMIIGAGVVVGIACACLNGFLINYLNIPGLFTGIVIMTVGKNVAALATQKVQMIVSVKVTHLDRFEFYFIIVVFVIILGYIILNHTLFGTYIKAIGSNATSALYSGIRVKRYAMAAYVITGITCGVAAFLRMLRLGAVTSASGVGVELDVILGLLLGGMPVTGGTSTKVRAPIIGVLMLYVLSNGLILMGVPHDMINLCKGVIFIFACWISMDRKRGETLI